MSGGPASRATIAAILARVSTPQQARSERHGIPNQLRACKAYAAQHGLLVSDDSVYVDAISGASESREAFYRLLDEADQYDAVIVYHVDRVGRDEEISHRFIRLLREAGLEVHATNRGLVEADFLTAIEIAMSAEERRNIKRRTSAGLKAVAMDGKLPQGITTFGYRNIKGENRAEIHEVEAKLVRRVFKLSAGGMTATGIARLLNDEGTPTAKGHLWHTTQVARMLRNATYKGEYEWTMDGVTFTIPVPAIVAPDVWRKAQKRRRGPPSTYGRPLTGFVRCGKCGASLSLYTSRHGDWSRVYYRCGSAGRPQGWCRAKIAPADKLEATVKKALKRLLSNKARLVELAQQSAADNEPDPTGVLEALREEEARLLEAMQKGFITVDEYGASRADVRRRMEAATPKRDEEPDVEAIMQAARGASLRELLELTNASVVVLDGNVSVNVRF